MRTLKRWRTDGKDDDPVSQELLDRPGLAGNVDVHPPEADGASWVVERGQREYIRVGKDLGRLLSELDGCRGPEELAARLGAPWTPQVVMKVVGDLHDRGLLEDGSERRSSGARWVKFVPPLTVQFTLLRPQRVLAVAAPVVQRLAGRAGLTTAGVVAVGGILALLVQGRAIGDALSTPLSVDVYLAVLAGVLLGTILHEMAHGAALVHYGGRPSRIGFMLFYLSPAFFCDISDAWRLPFGWQRVRIALAGITMQALVACGAALVALVGSAGWLSEDVRHGLLLFSVAGLVVSVLNLVPFVKLDGYIALMSWLDVPHLRDRSMTDARRLIARALFAGRYERELPDLKWVPLYGLACMAFPVFVVFQALALWVDLLSRIGVVGATLLFCAMGYLAYLLVRGVIRVTREGIAAHAPHWRVGASLVAVGGLLVAALLVVSVPYRVAGGYVTEGGTTSLVVPRNVGEVRIPTGSEVELSTNGPVLHTRTGSTATVAEDGEPATAPLATFVPVRLDRKLTTPVVRYPLSITARPAAPLGAASVDLGDRPLVEWLYRTYAAPAIDY